MAIKEHLYQKILVGATKEHAKLPPQ